MSKGRPSLPIHTAAWLKEHRNMTLLIASARKGPFGPSQRTLNSTPTATVAVKRSVRGRALALPLLLAALAAGPVAADEVTKWSELASQIALNSGLADSNPLFQTRILAMTHAAVHDAVNAVDRRYRSYSSLALSSPGAHPDAAVAAAARTVLLSQFNALIPFGFPSQEPDINTAYSITLAAIPNGTAKTLGIAAGEAAAAQILTLRAGDGAYQLPLVDLAYPQGTAPGQYRFTAPFNFAFATKWGTLTPFALDDVRRLRPNSPYPINSKRYTDDFDEVKRLGGDGVTTPSARTEDQTEIARFWLESSPIGWNRIARAASATAGLNLWENARLFALLNLALADGYIASLAAKYQHNFWRPITAIHEAETDGNAATAADPAWTPLATTPPIPDHDSAHSVEGGAAAEVLERFFGDTRFSFRTCSTSLPGGSRCQDPSPVFRSYRSFSEAADENGLSRIYVGFHFRYAVSEGIQHGRRIGHWTIEHYLKPSR